MLNAPRYKQTHHHHSEALNEPVGQRRKFRSALPKAVKYFTDNKINNNWKMVDVNFKDDAIIENARWAVQGLPRH